jgi:nucleotide-binding universal stress UspA family protein
MILICYDGSVDSKAAIEHAAELLSAEPATVLTVWEPFSHLLARTPAGFVAATTNEDMERVDRVTRENAERRAQEGGDLARDAGFEAHPRTCSQESTVSDAILSEADEVGASAIVMGSRGLTGLKSLLLGSVSHAVIQHADRAVMVVPSPDVAAARGRARREADR